MSLASRQRDRITHDRAGLAGKQTKRRSLPERQTTGKRTMGESSLWFRFASVAVWPNRISFSSLFSRTLKKIIPTYNTKSGGYNNRFSVVFAVF